MTNIISVEKSFKARQDLKEIWRYTYKNHSLKQANKYYNELEQGFNTIMHNPYIGVALDGVREGYRKYHINKHLAIYKITKNTIYIVRLLHEKMDYILHI